MLYVLYVPKRGRGRPPMRDWDALRSEMIVLISSGWGLGRLSKRYGISQPGMKGVLKRQGLRTFGMR